LPALQLETHLDGSLKSGESRILIDFNALGFISSAGLRVLLSYAKRTNKAGYRLALSGMSPSVRAVFELVGFISISTIYPTSEKASIALKQPEGGTK